MPASGQDGLTEARARMSENLRVIFSKILQFIAQAE
jgi:hypothetical protein